MTGLLDIDGARVLLNGTLYEMVEIAVGTNLDVIWPNPFASGKDTRFFTEVYDTEDPSRTVGAEAIYDLYIKDFSASSGSGSDEAETKKNISELLRHLYFENTGTEQEPIPMLRSDLPLYTAVGGFNNGTVATGVLDTTLFYRLDDWGEDMSEEPEAWLLSASLGLSLHSSVQSLLTRTTALENTIAQLEDPTGNIIGGTNVTFDDTNTSQGYGVLTIGEDSYEISVAGHTHSIYLLADTFNALFDVSDSLLKIKKVDDNTPRSLEVPGAVSASSASVTGNVSAGGDITADDDITAGDDISAGGDISSGGSITATGNITAGNTASNEALNPYILYRLDSWSSYSSSTQDWVPSAKLVHDMLADISQLQEDVVAAAGTGGTTVSWGTAQTNYVPLTVAGVTKNISLAAHTHQDYLLASIFNNLFTVANDKLTIKKVDNNTARALDVPGNIASAGSITATGNITAGNTASNEALNSYILYRLDDWENYSTESGSSTTDWVPSAEIVKERFDDIEDAIGSIEAAISNMGSGTIQSLSLSVPTGFSVSGSPVTGSTGAFVISFAQGYSLPTDAQQAAWTAIADLFTITDTNAALNVKSGQTVRNLSVPGSIVATGNITAGGVASNEALNPYVLYRLDSWSGYSDEEYGDWVPSAELVNALRGSSGSVDVFSSAWSNYSAAYANYVPTAGIVNSRFNTLENTDTEHAGRLTTLEGRPRIIFIQPNASYPADAQMLENVLYVKLSQTSS